MADIKYAEEIYNKVIADYESGCIDQKQLASRYNISVKAVAWCTQYYGFHHTKAKKGKKPICFDKHLEELAVLIER